MGGGNGQKSKMARERNAEKNKAAKGTCIHPSPSLPSIPGFPSLARQSPSDLIPSISYLCLLAGSQLETNKKAMNIQVRTIPHPSFFSSPPLAPPICLSTLPYPTQYPILLFAICSCRNLRVRQGGVSRIHLGRFQATPSGFAASGHPRRDSHPSLSCCSSCLPNPTMPCLPFTYYCYVSMHLQAVDSSGMAEYYSSTYDFVIVSPLG